MCAAADSSGRRLSSGVLGEVAERRPCLRGARRAGRQAAGDSSLISVVLPAPLRPRRPMRSPGRMVSFMPDRIGLSGVAGGGVLELQQRVGGGAAFAEAEAERVVDVGRGDGLHPLQGLDAALGLAGLGGLGAEAVDMNFCRWARSRCCFSNSACCWDRRSARWRSKLE